VRVAKESVNSADRQEPKMFNVLFHADWSTSSNKRWAVCAVRQGSGWYVMEAFQVTSSAEFLNRLFSTDDPVLAGFDFPIGVPAGYGARTGAGDFLTALELFGHGRWFDFYRIAETASEVSIERPFYPRVSSANAKQAHLLNAHGVSSSDALRRQCERATDLRQAACPLFWTLGGNQVGKAAIAGWQEIIAPARARGARLWPFDGSLQELSREAVVLAETYPAEAYGHIDVKFDRSRESKRRQEDRASKATAISKWAERNHVEFSAEMLRSIQGGFSRHATGEDRFDAALGLFGMIEVVEGRRAEGGSTPDARSWEGWILGQAA